MHAATANFTANDRRGDNLALAFLDQHNRHALANTFSSYVTENTGTLAVQRQMHRRFLGLIVKAGLRIGQVVASQNHFRFQQQIAATTLGVTLQAKRNNTAGQGRLGLRAVIHHANFQRRSAAQNVFGLRRVLHTRQLHHNAVRTLALNHGFGHTQFVNSVVQCSDVLAQGVLARLLFNFWRQRRYKRKFSAVFRSGKLQVRVFLGQGSLRLVAGFCIAEGQVKTSGRAGRAGIPQIFFAQGLLGAGQQGVLAFFKCSIHVHLQQEMHTTPQIETQVHGQCIDVGQPVR